MSRLSGVNVIPRRFKPDPRGWFLKVIDGTEAQLPAATGEVYLTLAVPGEVRGNHYHKETSEWFTVVQGRAQLSLLDPATGDRREMMLDASEPVTVYVPNGVAHAFKNPSDAPESMLLVAYADRLYEADDTVPMHLL
jgi:dTDP-4-dehydrorhamnose 3,5-epimerase-like enzyme